MVTSAMSRLTAHPLIPDPSLTPNRSQAHGRPGVAAGGELDLRQTGDLMRFTIAVNFCGLPALSVPVGHSAQGAA